MQIDQEGGRAFWVLPGGWRTRAVLTSTGRTFQAALDVVYFVLDRTLAAIFCGSPRATARRLAMVAG